MIDIFFEFMNEFILVRIEGSNVQFANTTYNNNLATIDGLKLNQQGVIKEFPDLKDNVEWRRIAITRFKDKIKTLETEEKISDYIITDLRKYGYIPKYKQRKGFRIIKIQ